MDSTSYNHREPCILCCGDTKALIASNVDVLGHSVVIVDKKTLIVVDGSKALVHESENQYF